MHLVQDFRYGLRIFRLNPAITAISIVALALGIGANTAIFTVVNSVLLRPLRYPESDRVVLLMRAYQSRPSFTVSPSKFVYWRDHARGFSGLAASDVLGSGFNLSGSGEPERLTGIRVSAGYFDVLGMPPVVGRSFLPEEDTPGAAKVVVLSDSLWKRRFAADSTLVGRSITLGGEPHVVIGILAPEFQSTPPAELYVPLRAQLNPEDRGNLLNVFGRLKPGIGIGAAQQDARRIGEAFRSEYPNLMSKDESILVGRFQDQLTGPVTTPLYVLLGSVGLVLLIACANVANLLLARSASRRREMAMRAALGASRSRIATQLLTESAILGVAGGTLGLILAFFGLPALLSMVPGDLPRAAEISIDLRVLCFSLAAAVFTGLLFGLAPAIQASRVNLVDALKEGARTGGAAHGGRLRQGLVVGEFALSLVLLVGASLLLRTFANLQAVNPGFDSSNVLTFQISMSGDSYDTAAETATFYRNVLRRLEAAPGVEAASTVTNLPMEMGPDLPFEVEGRPDSNENDAQWRHITPAYFRAMRIPVLRGREFTERETGTSEPVVIINEALARRVFPKEDPLGRRLHIGRIMGPTFADRPRTIIAVVGDVREEGLAREAPPTLFVPADQVPDGFVKLGNSIMPSTWVVRTSRSALSLAPVLRREILQVSPTQPISNVRPLEQVLHTSLARQRFAMTLLTVFAILALMLAAIGIYGVMSWAVAQRIREFGVRMALGAQRRTVLGMVLRRAMLLALGGIAVGAAAAYGLARLLTTMLYGVQSTDPVSFAATASILSLVALMAGFVPAWRATRVNPIAALRCE